MSGPPSAPRLPVVRVVMTDRDVVARIARLVGRALVSAPPRQPRYKPSYIVSIKGTAAVGLMRAVHEYMSEARRAQVDRVMARWKGDASVPEGRPVLGRGRPVPPPAQHACDATCERAWLAGLLEGEGSFTTTQAGGRSYPVIALKMCAEDVVRRVAGLMGAQWVNRHEPVDRRWRVTFATGLSGARAAGWMRELRPQMGERRRMAIDAALASYRPIRLSDPPEICAVPDCREPHRSRGLCHKHYMSWLRDVAKGRTPRVAPLR